MSEFESVTPRAFQGNSEANRRGNISRLGRLNDPLWNADVLYVAFKNQEVAVFVLMSIGCKSVVGGAQLGQCSRGGPRTPRGQSKCPIGRSGLLLNSCDSGQEIRKASNAVNVSGPAVITGQRAKVRDQTLTRLDS